MARAPSNPPADGDEGFLSRWSRRKVEERAAPDDDRGPGGVGAVDTSAPSQLPVAAPRPAVTPEVAVPEPQPEPLPSIESLTAESDYKIFLRPGVPAGVQRDALRKLWATVPALAPIEIAETHMGDFNDVPTFPDGLKETIYDVVRGFVDRATEPGSDVTLKVDDIAASAEPPLCKSPNDESPVADAAPGSVPEHDVGDDSQRD